MNTNQTPPPEVLGSPSGSVSSEPLHVYDWLDQPAADENERLAKEWLEQFVKPAHAKDHDWLDARALVCKYRGEIYRCVGASRMGDVWLTSKITSPDGYEKRVSVEELSDWMRVDLPDAPAPKPPRRKSALMGILAATAMLAGSYGFGMGGGRSSAMERNDPNREKTPEDLERMAAAQRKRDRKAARKGPQNERGLATAPQRPELD